MAPLRSYMLPAMAAVAAVKAVQIESYVPGCAPDCIYEAVDTHSTCEVSDSECLCLDIYSLKRHSEECLKESCSDTEYGEAMLGYDNFCKDVDSGAPAPTTDEPAPTTEPGETTAAPPPETTEEPVPEPEPTTVEGTMSIPEDPSSVPTDNPEAPVPTETSDAPVDPTMPTFTNVPIPTTSGGDDTTPVPTPTPSESPEPSTTSDDGGDDDGSEPTETPTTPPDDAGAHVGASLSVLIGAVVMATFMSL